jgi:hypothetical protein
VHIRPSMGSLPNRCLRAGLPSPELPVPAVKERHARRVAHPGKTPQQPHDHTSARLTIGKLLMESVL